MVQDAAANEHLESFHGRLKFEYVWPADPESFQGDKKVTLSALVDYNTRRLCSSILYMPPAEFAAKCEGELMTGGAYIFSKKRSQFMGSSSKHPFSF